MLSAKADVLEEFVKSFGPSWFGVRGIGPNPDKLTPCMIAKDRSTTKEHLPIAYMVDSTGRMLSHDLRWETERQNIDRKYPSLGAMKAGPSVAYLTVKPRRQFKKGYVPENVNMFIPNEAAIKKLFPRMMISKTSKKLVWQIFNREYWTPKAAIALLEEGEEVGYPLPGGNFFVYLDEHWDCPVLARKTRIVGAYRDGVFRLLPENTIFKEEFERDTKEKIYHE